MKQQVAILNNLSEIVGDASDESIARMAQECLDWDRKGVLDQEGALAGLSKSVFNPDLEDTERDLREAEFHALQEAERQVRKEAMVRFIEKTRKEEG